MSQVATTILNEIGLGEHPLAYMATEDPERARSAAHHLGTVIQEHHDRGDPIDSPYRAVIEGVIKVAEQGRPNATTLYATWEAASYAIRAHVNGFRMVDSRQRTHLYERCFNRIEAYYLSSPTKVYELNRADLLYEEYEDADDGEGES